MTQRYSISLTLLVIGTLAVLLSACSNGDLEDRIAELEGQTQQLEGQTQQLKRSCRAQLQ